MGERLNREITLSRESDGSAVRLRARLADDEFEDIARRYAHARRQTDEVEPLPAADDGLIVTRDLVRSYSRFKGQWVKDARTGKVSHRLSRVLAGEITEFLMERLATGVGG